MMKDQHEKIKGYRDLSEDEIDMINAIKEQGEKLSDMIKILQGNPYLDQRWVSIAQTDLQKGIMAAVRSVAKPESF